MITDQWTLSSERTRGPEADKETLLKRETNGSGKFGPPIQPAALNQKREQVLPRGYAIRPSVPETTRPGRGLLPHPDPVILGSKSGAGG